MRVLRTFALLLAAGCASPSLSEPVVANTGSARSDDGYEAALAAAEAGGFSIGTKDRANAFVRVQSRTSLGLEPSQSVYLDVKAWKGSVDVHIAVPQGLSLEQPRLDRVLGERREFAWAVATRARLIAGEPVSASGSNSNYDRPGWGRPYDPHSTWVLP